MKIAGDYVFDGTREEVWKNLRDPEVLASALPGTKNLTKISETEYEAEMNVRVGPVVGTFTGRFLISNESPMGQALLKHKVGECVTVRAPAGELRFHIIAVK